MEVCKVCGGGVIPNARKTPTANPKMPDYLCNQENGRCGEDAEYTNRAGKIVQAFNPTPAWKPKEGGFGQYAKRPTPEPVTPRLDTPQASPAMVVPPYQRSPLLEPKTVKEESPDWDAIAEGKVRHGVVCSLIEAGRTKEEILVQAPFWVKYIMNGEVAAPAPSNTADEIDVSGIPF